LTVPEDWPQEGNIKFEGVSLRYDTEREPVMSKLDLTIPAGQKVRNQNMIKSKFSYVYMLRRLAYAVEQGVASRLWQCPFSAW
jgi:hypothetical protein